MNTPYVFYTNINKPWIFYFSTFISYLYNGIIGPLFVAYLLSINFNAAQIGILLATQRVSIILFEIPTGVLADKYGRKKSVLASFTLMAILLFVWFLSQDFTVLLLVSIGSGLAFTLQSGAKESLMIDSLNLSHDDSKRNRVFARLSIFGNLGFILGGLLSMVLVFYFIKSIWLAASFFNVLLFVLYLFFVKEVQIKTDIIRIENRFTELLKTTKENFIVIFKSRPIFLLLSIGFIFSLITAVYSLSYPILFKETFNIPNYYFGFLGALSGIVGIAGAWLGQKLSQKKGYYFTLGFFSIILMASFILLGFSQTVLLLVAVFAMIEFGRDGWFPIYQSFLNKFIPTKVRAGVLSINSTTGILAIAAGELLAGFLLITIFSGKLIIASGLLFVIIPFLLLNIRKSLKPATIDKINQLD